MAKKVKLTKELCNELAETMMTNGLMAYHPEKKEEKQPEDPEPVEAK